MIGTGKDFLYRTLVAWEIRPTYKGNLLELKHCKIHQQKKGENEQNFKVKTQKVKKNSSNKLPAVAKDPAQKEKHENPKKSVKRVSPSQITNP